jgi:hypothetical protein
MEWKFPWKIDITSHFTEEMIQSDIQNHETNKMQQNSILPYLAIALLIVLDKVVRFTIDERNVVNTLRYSSVTWSLKN